MDLCVVCAKKSLRPFTHHHCVLDAEFNQGRTTLPPFHLRLDQSTAAMTIPPQSAWPSRHTLMSDENVIQSEHLRSRQEKKMCITTSLMHGGLAGSYPIIPAGCDKQTVQELKAVKQR
jgi:hypothetical protein